MFLRKQNKKKKGFTLIELIIVIAIIAILAAIAIPNFLAIQRKARVKADIASAKTIYDATSALIAEGKITTDESVVLNPGSTDEISKYLQTIPVSQSVSGDVFAVKIDIDGTPETSKGKNDAKPARIEVYLVAKDSTIKDDSTLVYPTTTGEYAINNTSSN
ncbi:prepilin-type N-terminal cleavage/methylation domain-containing protein [Clostridium perfringens]|uniref:prepilin-type N-terminal cleavage/methylation domain-containing protein n=1 Tax=Clostridium perfringens TaxID=1502 RepID=UPI000DA396A5|nr:prepilin-type N-terminal cleavage/methylation domain-containing protein [Clostridium perfringens]MBO3374599.1 prepilin-type N-terminal cleavage/methylation domain-containing protein [Clostridium perfringens]MDH5081206.1 Fimbrial protein precursor [Clostridium perfringens]SQG41092.1 type IV pilin [Clostridium perfringens]